jgi:L-seryl-tRNA(Ser) seleniumtransferase
VGPSSAEDLRRRLPSVEHLLHLEEVREHVRRHGRSLVLREVRTVLASARAEAAQGHALVEAHLLRVLAERLATAFAPSLRRVINATGVVIHTNLGRAPLPPLALERVREAASSYSNLEFDLDLGERGRRETHLRRLAELTGSEAALVVNNNAAAVLLAVNTLAEGRDVLVSRGELVEIGGSFRIPDVIRKGGARLQEVGTTNRTRIEDYERALSPETALILKVHPSNFAMVGFTEEAPLEGLVALARSKGLPLVEDLGSGLLDRLPPPLEGEPLPRESLEKGVDLVTFSGDKLLGGPQAGLVVGSKSHVASLLQNPLYRALRVDKMTLAALDAILLLHESGRGSTDVPVLRMLSLRPEDLRTRVERLVDGLGADGITSRTLEGTSAVGGGAAPTAELPTILVAIPGSDRLSAALRREDPPVVARVKGGELMIDLRTVAEADDALLQSAIVRATKTTREDG